jgi:hypothetical protein
MNTTTTSPNTPHCPGTPPANAIVAWDELEKAVDRLADVVDRLLAGHDEQVVCSLRFVEAEALAEVLDAGRRTRTAARLMHHWALTEPDWDIDREHETILRSWLDIDTRPQQVGLDP